jgi:hypothetical protein
MIILAGRGNVAPGRIRPGRLATRRGSDEGVRPYVICASLGEGADNLIFIISVLCTMLLLLPPGSGSYPATDVLLVLSRRQLRRNPRTERKTRWSFWSSAVRDTSAVMLPGH